MTTLALFNFVSGWWNELGLARQIFYGIGLFAGLVSIVMALLAFLGADHADAADVGDAVNVDHDGGGILSTKPLTGFFLGFGWAGGIALESGLTLIAALAIAFVAGGALMALIVVILRALYSMKSDGTMRIGDAVGAVGTVYITLPPSRAAGGQVVVNFSGRQETFSALTKGDRAIPSGDKIRVVSVLDGHTVVVEPLA